MNLLRRIFFPVPYPAAIIYHIILGAFLAIIVDALFFHSGGHGYVWLPITGAVVMLVIGFLLARK